MDMPANTSSKLGLTHDCESVGKVWRTAPGPARVSTELDVLLHRFLFCPLGHLEHAAPFQCQLRRTADGQPGLDALVVVVAGLWLGEDTVGLVIPQPKSIRGRTKANSAAPPLRA